MKEIAIKHGVTNQEYHGFKVLVYRTRPKEYREFEPCFRFNLCFICKTRFAHYCLTCPIEGRSKITSNVKVPIEIKGDGQKSPLSKIQKPYDFARSKINFSMEDLENSSEGDDWDSDSSLAVSNSSHKFSQGESVNK